MLQGGLIYSGSHRRLPGGRDILAGLRRAVRRSNQVEKVWVNMEQHVESSDVGYNLEC